MNSHLFPKFNSILGDCVVGCIRIVEVFVFPLLYFSWIVVSSSFRQWLWSIWVFGTPVIIEVSSGTLAVHIPGRSRFWILVWCDLLLGCSSSLLYSQKALPKVGKIVLISAYSFWQKKESTVSLFDLTQSYFKLPWFPPMCL